MRQPATPDNDELEKFELFLCEMDDVLEDFVSQAQTAGVVLDYTVASLDALEAYIGTTLQAGAPGELVKNRASRYLGEVFRRTVGGKWQLCLRDPKYLYFKLPVIANYSSKPIEFSPVSIISNYTIRRKPGLLRAAVEASARWATLE
jgi:hypothetical protein